MFGGLQKKQSCPKYDTYNIFVTWPRTCPKLRNSRTPKRVFKQFNSDLLLGNMLHLWKWESFLQTVTLAYSCLFLFPWPGCTTDEECPEPKHSAQCGVESPAFGCACLTNSILFSLRTYSAHLWLWLHRDPWPLCFRLKNTKRESSWRKFATQSLLWCITFVDDIHEETLFLWSATLKRSLSGDSNFTSWGVLIMLLVENKLTTNFRCFNVTGIYVWCWQYINMVHEVFQRRQSEGRLSSRDTVKHTLLPACLTCCAPLSSPLKSSRQLYVCL